MHLLGLVYYSNITKIHDIEGDDELRSLKAELAHVGVIYSAAAELLSMSMNNFGLKVNDRMAMTVDEMKRAQAAFFPSASLDYLRQSDGDKPAEVERNREAIARFEEPMKDLGPFDGRAQMLVAAARVRARDDGGKQEWPPLKRVIDWIVGKTFGCQVVCFRLFWSRSTSSASLLS